MGRLADFETLINKVVPHWAGVKLMPRGVPIYIDRLLRGQTRFAKKFGASLSVLAPDVTIPLDRAYKRTDRILHFDRAIPKWFAPNCVVSLGPYLELARIADVLDANTVLLDDDLRGPHEPPQLFRLFAVPLITFNTAYMDETRILVRSPYKITPGDSFAYLPNPSILESLQSILITAVTEVVATPIDGYPYIYDLTLASSIQTNAIHENETVYLRANPAYFSEPVFVPVSFVATGVTVGPYLVDFVSLPLADFKMPKEQLSLRATSELDVYVIGDEYRFKPIPKNYFVHQVPIPVDALLFWQRLSGAFAYRSNRTLVIKAESPIPAPTSDSPTNPIRDFWTAGLYTELIPAWEFGALPDPKDRSWKIPVKAIGEFKIKFRFKVSTDPNQIDPFSPWQEFELRNNQSRVLGVAFPQAQVSGIEIVVTAKRECTVEMLDWVPMGYSTYQLEYAMVSEAWKEATYQASGAIVKPVFLSLDYLKLRLDSGQSFDNGSLFL